MDIFLEKLLAQGPLGVLVACVFLFLYFNEKTARAVRAWQAEEAKANREMIERMHGDHIVARTETRLSLDKNTAAMMENTAAAKELAVVVRSWKP